MRLPVPEVVAFFLRSSLAFDLSRLLTAAGFAAAPLWARLAVGLLAEIARVSSPSSSSDASSTARSRSPGDFAAAGQETVDLVVYNVFESAGSEARLLAEDADVSVLGVV